MKFLLPFLLTFAIAPRTYPATFTNGASADSFVRVAAPTLNYGGAGALSVSGSNAVNGSGIANGAFDSFIRFNSAALVTNFDSLFGSNNWLITRAILHVTEMGASANGLFNRGTGAFEIRWIANDTWLEGTGNPNAPTTNGITYNDEQLLLNAASDASLGTFTNAGIDGTLSFSLALPEKFNADLKAGGEVGLYLTAIDPAIGFTVDSRSFGTVSARPFLEISALPRPGIAEIQISQTNVVLACTNVAAGEKYQVLSITNLALPASEWMVIATNLVPTNGEFTISLANSAVIGPFPQRFFILHVQ